MSTLIRQYGAVTDANGLSSVQLNIPQTYTKARVYVTPGFLNGVHNEGLYTLSINELGGVVYSAMWTGTALVSETQIQEYFPINGSLQGLINLQWNVAAVTPFRVTIIFKE